MGSLGGAYGVRTPPAAFVNRPNALAARGLGAQRGMRRQPLVALVRAPTGLGWWWETVTDVVATVTHLRVLLSLTEPYSVTRRGTVAPPGGSFTEAAAPA